MTTPALFYYILLYFYFKTIENISLQQSSCLIWSERAVLEPIWRSFVMFDHIFYTQIPRNTLFVEILITDINNHLSSNLHFLGNIVSIMENHLSAKRYRDDYLLLNLTSPLTYDYITPNILH